MRRTLLLLAVVLAGAVSTASAQAELHVEISVDPATRNPRPRLRNLMNDQRWREAIDDAFRISLNWQVDLYRTRALWLPSREAQFEATIVVWREPLLGQYQVTILLNGRVVRELSFTSVDAFTFFLEQPLQITNMAPRTEGEYYYVATLKVSALDNKQFAEMQRFIGPGNRSGGGDPVGTYLLKLVGVPSRTYGGERSERFSVP